LNLGKFVCSVTTGVPPVHAWAVKSCTVITGKVILEFQSEISAATELTVKLSHVVWPKIDETHKVYVEVQQWGIVAYTGVAVVADQKFFDAIGEAAEMQVSLSKSYNTVYAGSIWEFKVTPNEETEFSSSNYMHVAFPTTYAPELGNVVCSVNKKTVPCAVDSPWWLTITGPSTPTGSASEFTLVIRGVRQIEGSSSAKIYLGLSNGYSTDVSLNHNQVLDSLPNVPHSYVKQAYISDFDVSTRDAFNKATIIYELSFEAGAPGTA